MFDRPCVRNFTSNLLTFLTFDNFVASLSLLGEINILTKSKVTRVRWLIVCMTC